jgi:hypothetical protein
MLTEHGLNLEAYGKVATNEAVAEPISVYEQIRRDAYSIAAEKYHLDHVRPESKYCWFVNREASTLLGKAGFGGAYLASARRDGEILHAFIAVDLPAKEVLDYQYQQFLPEELRTEDLPDYMRIPYTSKEDVIAGLTEHKIPERFHDYWLDELEGTDRFPSRFRSPIYAASLREPERTF